ncbi:MAG: cation diffusion facilitator family transporter [Clostridia bacterium]|nr:cation diffusion facilitator family transporter [Clostridia bacterium]
MDRFKSVRLASILGIAGNVFLLVIKATVGLLTGSQAMIADSFNSAGDIFSSVMTFIGNKIASKPDDEDHNLGHGKAEYIYSMFISIVMIVMSLIIIKNSATSIFFHNKYDFSVWLVIVCVITIVTKLSLFLYTNKIAKKLNNLLIKANSEDHRNDCIVTLCNLISCLVSLKGVYWIDGIVGIGIAIWILVSAIKIFIQSYDVLMDKCIDDNTKKEVLDIISKHKEIQKITHFNSTPVGYKYQISFSIFVDGNLSTFESHDIADKLEKEIDKEIEEVYLTVIHVNPI